ncbi:MAG: response regulator [Patescibacteria group bacterium]|nr:response regulator [Patescibacteria group bacterium]
MIGTPRILIVEDEPDLRGVYTDALSGEGYQLDTAVDGDEAVQKILQGGWDLILLDIVMPKKNGFDVLETVRRTIIDPTQKQQVMDSIIFMTNLDNMADLTHALSLGPKEYVVKTQVTPGQVQELVRSYLEKKTSHATSAVMQQTSVPAAPADQTATPAPAAFSLPAAPIQPDIPPVISQPIPSQSAPVSSTEIVSSAVDHTSLGSAQQEETNNSH